MKELTIEQKARAYDEAIKKAAALYKASEPMSGCNVIIETLFPELKESENDKIRKWIINEIKIKHHNLDDENVDFADKAIAWLEKQGSKDKFIEKELGCIKGYREKAIKRLEELEKQDEQKASYTTIVETGDGGINALVIRDIEIPFGAKDSELQEFTYFIPQGYYAKIEDDKVVIKKGEQKPEENKGNIREISSNWSEEDEVKINRIVACLENLTVADNDILLKDVEWLKSLKPQNNWKPSNEQIRALKHAFNDGSITFAEMEILATLYEGLKSFI